MASTRCSVEHNASFGHLRAETEGDRLVRLESGCNPAGSHLALRREPSGVGGTYSWAGAGGKLELVLQAQGCFVGTWSPASTPEQVKVSDVHAGLSLVQKQGDVVSGRIAIETPDQRVELVLSPDRTWTAKCQVASADGSLCASLRANNGADLEVKFSAKSAREETWARGQQSDT